MTGPGVPPPRSPLQVQRSMRLGPAAAGVGVGLVVLVAVGALMPSGGSAGPAATPTRPAASVSGPTAGTPTPDPTPTLTGPLTLAPASGTPSSPTPTVPAPTSAEPTAGESATPTSGPFPDVAGTRECARSGEGPYAAVGTGNSSTSCGFAINVWKAYLAAGIDGGTGSVTASSPATGKTYKVSCSGSQPARCTGGNAGNVLIYGGKLVRR